MDDHHTIISHTSITHPDAPFPLLVGLHGESSSAFFPSSSSIMEGNGNGNGNGWVWLDLDSGAVHGPYSMRFITTHV